MKGFEPHEHDENLHEHIQTTICRMYDSDKRCENMLRARYVQICFISCSWYASHCFDMCIWVAYVRIMSTWSYVLWHVASHADFLETTSLGRQSSHINEFGTVWNHSGIYLAQFEIIWRQKDPTKLRDPNGPHWLRGRAGQQGGRVGWPSRWKMLNWVPA
jgi:hypothetical protein